MGYILNDLSYPKNDDNLKGLIESINDYHKRIPSQEAMLEASKNSVTQSLLTISKKIGNIFSGERPVDMDDPRNATALTDKAQDARELARENPASIAMQIIQQNAGKSVVGISAVAEKVFMASSYYINQELRKIESLITDDFDDTLYIFKQFEKIASVKPIRFKDGSIIIPNLIANSNFRNVPKLKPYYEAWINNISQEYQEEFNSNSNKKEGAKLVILDVNSQKDASLVISAVLSAATDNAKELILDKINAGPELAGVYMYMVMQGVPFMDIAKLMISPTINKVVAKSKQNWFTKENKNNSIESGIAYYLEGVNPYNYFDEIGRAHV